MTEIDDNQVQREAMNNSVQIRSRSNGCCPCSSRKKKNDPTRKEKKPKERKFLVSSNFVRNENKPPTNRLRKNQSEWKSALLPSSSTTTRLKRDLVLWLWVWSSLPSEGCCHSDREPAQAPPMNDSLVQCSLLPEEVVYYCCWCGWTFEIGRQKGAS